MQFMERHTPSPKHAPFAPNCRNGFNFCRLERTERDFCPLPFLHDGGANGAPAASQAPKRAPAPVATPASLGSLLGPLGTLLVNGGHSQRFPALPTARMGNGLHSELSFPPPLRTPVGQGLGVGDDEVQVCIAVCILIWLLSASTGSPSAQASPYSPANPSGVLRPISCSDPPFPEMFVIQLFWWCSEATQPTQTHVVVH